MEYILLLKLNRYRRLEIWRSLLAQSQMYMAFGKGNADVAKGVQRCKKGVRNAVNLTNKIIKEHHGH